MDGNQIESLTEATKDAGRHFAKAAFEVAAGVSALVVGIVKTVKNDDDTSGPETVERIVVE